MKSVTVIAFPKALGTSITLPIEMLNAADTIRGIKGGSRSALEINLATMDGRPLEIAGGITLNPDKQLSDINQTDLVIVPAMWGNPRPVVRRHGYIVDWLLDRHAQQATICATGTGTCFLAETGLLDHKPATTHWYYFDRFSRDYPNIKLETKRFITNAGNLYCAGRINSITNLMIHFIEQHYNYHIARQIEQHFAHEIKPTYEGIYYAFDEQSVHHDEQIIQAQQWILRNYAEPFSLKEVAGQFEMSLRTFNRRFKKATGTTPLEYSQQVRIGTARELLKDSNLSIAEISYRVGFSDPGYFSSLFRRMVSLSPRDYRKLVRAKLFKV